MNTCNWKITRSDLICCIPIIESFWHKNINTKETFIEQNNIILPAHLILILDFREASVRSPSFFFVVFCKFLFVVNKLICLSLIRPFSSTYEFVEVSLAYLPNFFMTLLTRGIGVFNKNGWWKRKVSSQNCLGWKHINRYSEVITGSWRYRIARSVFMKHTIEFLKKSLKDLFFWRFSFVKISFWNYFKNILHKWKKKWI